MRFKKRPPPLIPDPPERIDAEEVARLYVEERLSYAEIARRLGRSWQGIRLVLIRQGIPRRKSRARGKARHYERLRGLWKRLRAQCQDRRDSSFKYSGTKGIRLGEEWQRFRAFFDWAMSSGYQPGWSLVLKEGKKVHAPGNCRWISPAEMVRRRLQAAPPPPRRLVTAFGETKGVAAWARDPRCRVTVDSLCLRLDRGLSPEEAIARPPRSVPGAAARARRRSRQPKRRRRRPRAASKLWQRVVRLHVEEGLSCPEIARRVGRSSSTILEGLKQRGVYRRRKGLHHGLKWGKRLLHAWYRMHGRCSRQTHPEFRYYGARGIRVARVWKRFELFHAWALAAGYRPGLCLTRIDRKRGFSPDNCAWVPRAETAHRAQHPVPVRRPQWTVSAFGETKGPTAWSRDPRCAVSLTALCLRLRSGMPPEEAITLPRRRPAGKRWLRLVSAFGETRSLAQWSRDRRCRVSAETLGKRLSRGVAPETAISTPPFKLHEGKPPER